MRPSAERVWLAHRRWLAPVCLMAVATTAAPAAAQDMVVSAGLTVRFIMITDVVMPGLSGREVAERATGLRPEMRVLYVSGYTDDALGRHGVLDPGMAFLEKPFSTDALFHRVRQILDAR